MRQPGSTKCQKKSNTIPLFSVKIIAEDKGLCMKKIHLRLAELRKKYVTRQELAEVISVSFQTIGKWKTGVSHS